MLGAALRYQGSYSVWNRLYKMGHCYLDLSLKADEGAVFLVGQVICESQKPSAWHITHHGAQQRYRGFRIKVTKKGLEHETFWVRGLDIS